MTDETKSFIDLINARLQRLEQSIRLLQTRHSRKAAHARQAEVHTKLRENIRWAEKLLAKIG
jgi:hypothetical protein